MKKLTGILILYTAILLIGGCAVPLGENFSMSRETTQTGTPIIYYNLQTYVPVPVAGEQPVSAVTDRGDLEVSVVWIKGNTELEDLHLFEADAVYSAKIRLAPRTGYLFNDSIPFSYHPGKVSSQNDDKAKPARTVQVTFNNSDFGKLIRVLNYDLQIYVPAPVAGQLPKKDFNIEGVQGTVTWGGAALDAEGKFVKGGVYTAEIKLTPWNDYFFDPSQSFAYHPESKVESQNDDKAIPTRTVPVTYKGALEQVSHLDLTPYITTPVLGDSPNTNGFTDDQYTGSSVIWSPDGVFARNTTYTAVVNLTAAEGYTFDGLGKNAFSHSRGSVTFTVSGGGTVGTAVVTFSPGSSGDFEVHFPWGG